MKKLYFLLSLCFLTIFSFEAFAQKKGSIKAKVIDAKTSKPVDFATVSVVNAADSMVVKSTVTDKTGDIDVVGLNAGNYKLIVSQLGLKTLSKPFTITNGNTVDLGTLQMELAVNNLDEVLVKGEVAPVTVKKDTVEFNAGSYKTQPNDNVEGLLKKLPGFEVDKDGKITTQGKQVTKVLVEGKEFFGSDPKAATKNLPADAIDKVQLIDDKTDRAKNTGIDDGEREKVVNLKLKEDKKKGWFGNVSSAGGSAERYLASGSVNRFDKDKQIAMLFLSNNVNETGFTMEDLNNFTGGNIFDAFSSGNGMNTLNISSGGRVNVNGAFGGMSGGLITNHSGGVNYSDNWGKNKQFKFTGSVMAILNKNNITQLNEIEDIPNNQFTNKNAFGNGKSDSYRMNLNMDWKVDSLTNIRFKPSLSTTIRNNFSNSLSSSIGIQSPDSINRVSQNITQHSSSPAFGGQFSVNRRFSRGRGSVNFFTNGNYSVTNGDNLNNYRLISYRNSAANRTVNQSLDQDNNATFLNSTLSYVRQLSKRKKLNLTLSQNFDYQKQQADQYTVDYNPVSGYYDIVSPAFSGNTNNRTWRATTTAGLNKVGEKLTMNFNLGIANLGLNGEFFTNNTQYDPVNRNSWAIVPNANISYRQKNGRNFFFNLSSNVQLPQANDLQPVINNTDPLYIRQGNPGLKMSRSLNAGINYNYFDFKNNNYINFYGNFSQTWNGFSTASFRDTSRNTIGVTTSTPINTDGNYNAFFGANVGMPTKIKGLKINAGLNGNISRFVNFINDNKNAVTRLTPGVSLGGSFDNDKLSFSLRTYSTYNNAKNSYQSAADRVYYSFNNTLNGSVKPGKNWRIYSDVTQNLYREQTKTTGIQSNNANTTFYLWNAGIERYFLAKQNFTVALNAFDILDQNSGIQRSISNTGAIQNNITNTIGRYFYLKLTYKLTKLGGNASNSTPGVIIMR